MTLKRTAAVAAAAIAGSYLAMRSPRLEAAEARLAQWLRQPGGPVVDAVVGVTTDLGSVYAVAGAAGVLAVSGRGRAGRDLAAGALSAWVVAQAVKPMVGRTRPYQPHGGVAAHRLVAVPSGSAWPSGHPAVAAGAVVALTGLPGPARLVGHAVAVYVAWSRIYVGVHHPTDVVAGLGFGALCGSAAAAVLRRR